MNKESPYIKSIDRVIQKMDEIVEQCKRDNCKSGYFAVLYRYVTIRIKEGIENGEFDDNDRMVILDTIFAQRFFDAFDAYYNNSGEEITLSWKCAFDAAEKSRYVVMQHLLLGINAHINLDLGIAAAETMEGRALDEIQDDYFKVNAILASLVESVKSNISRVSLLFGPLMGLTRGRDEMFVNFSIVTARDGAWRFAHRYSQAGDKALAIKNRDAKIAELGSCLTETGPWLTFLLRLIRLGEFRPLPSNLDRLAGIVE